ncbi:hypothetical protein GCM10027615_36390 [Plantactinospora veratri]
MGEDLTGVRLRVRGETVARYVLDDPHVDLRWGRRPYLHPVRTLGGVVVTDTLPEDHRWHLGVSVAMQDVSGTNLWGGRTYVRDAGYTWLDDHGRIVHDGWLPDLPTPDADPEGGGAAGGNGLDGGPGEGGPGDGGFAERLRWLDPAGATLLTEERRVGATGLADRTDAWLLDFGYTLTAPADREIVLGSPATNGRPDGAGYGGFFWRVAPGPNRAFTASAEGRSGSTAVPSRGWRWSARPTAGGRTRWSSPVWPTATTGSCGPGSIPGSASRSPSSGPCRSRLAPRCGAGTGSWWRTAN